MKSPNIRAFLLSKRQDFSGWNHGCFLRKNAMEQDLNLHYWRFQLFLREFRSPLQGIRWVNAAKIIYKLSMLILFVSHEFMWGTSQVCIFHFKRKWADIRTYYSITKDNNVYNSWHGNGRAFISSHKSFCVRLSVFKIVFNWHLIIVSSIYNFYN